MTGTCEGACADYCDVIREPWTRGEDLGGSPSGTVYEALNRSGTPSFAVKEISSKVANRQQIEQICKHWSRLHHRNVIPFYGSKERDGKHLLFMELASPGSLETLYKRKGPLPEYEIKKFTRDTLQGLQYISENHLIHCNIKGSNVFLTDDGVCKIGDFELTKKIGEHGHADKRFLNQRSPLLRRSYWVPPECLEPDRTWSFSADVWSVGCLMVEMATAKHPFSDLQCPQALKVIGYGNGVPDIPTETILSESCRDFISKCLQRVPEDRPTAAQLLDEPFLKGRVGCLYGYPVEPTPEFIFESASNEDK